VTLVALRSKVLIAGFLRRNIPLFVFISASFFSYSKDLIARAVVGKGSDYSGLSKDRYQVSLGKSAEKSKCKGNLVEEHQANDLTWQFRTYYPPRRRIILFNNESDLFFGGAIRTDAYFVRNAETLRDDRNDDATDQFRQRSEFSFLFRHKVDHKDERAMVDSQMTFGNVMLWRTPWDATYQHSTIGSSFDREHWPMWLQLQESWVRLNIDKVLKGTENNNLSLKVGYFPFLVGRGISLGDWAVGGSTIAGFEKNGAQSYAPKFAPGILLTGTAIENVDYDLYYSPSVTESVNAGFRDQKYFSRQTNESASDRHIISARARAATNFYENSSSYLEPYFVYYNSPRNTKNAPSDSSIRFTTLGVMMDHKTKGFEINFEGAKQFGRQKMVERLNRTRPDIEKFISVSGTGAKSFNELGKLTNPGDTTPGQVLVQGEKGVNFLRRSTESDSATFAYAKDSVEVDATGTVVANAPRDGTGYHRHPANLEEWVSQSGSAQNNFYQYHHPYDLDLSGFMAVMDARYTFDDYPFQLSASAGYFSGDCYPYNDSVDEFMASDNASEKPITGQPTRKFNGFLPLRDYHYTGLWAHPMVMFNAGVVPRPYNMSLSDLTTYNEYDSATNLRYVAFGGTMGPTDDMKKFKLNGNVCFYWTDTDLYKWDKDATPPSGVQMFEDYKVKTSPLNKDGSKGDPTYQPLQGWISREAASSFLGWEINGTLSYMISDNIDLVARGGVFFPGQLFSDQEGQPNINTERSTYTVNTNGSIQEKNEHTGLGNHTAYGFNIRLRYAF
jgi:hypothetical protein